MRLFCLIIPAQIIGSLQETPSKMSVNQRKGHTEVQYHLITMIAAQCSVHSYVDPTTNVDSYAEEEKLYYKTFMF